MAENDELKTEPTLAEWVQDIRETTSKILAEPYCAKDHHLAIIQIHVNLEILEHMETLCTQQAELLAVLRLPERSLPATSLLREPL